MTEDDTDLADMNPTNADTTDKGSLPAADAAVDAGMWVTVQYRIFDSMREPVEETTRELRYLHGGFGAIFPKLEAALHGQTVNAAVSVTLQPEDAFGDYEADRITMIAAGQLPEGTEVGMTFDGVPGEPSDGNVYTVTDLAEGQAVLDGNHPLAGMSLRYDVTVVSVVPASAEEIEQERREADA